MSSFASHKRDLIQVLRAYRKLIMMIGVFSLATATVVPLGLVGRTAPSGAASMALHDMATQWQTLILA
jgi:hypothetical protein